MRQDEAEGLQSYGGQRSTCLKFGFTLSSAIASAPVECKKCIEHITLEH